MNITINNAAQPLPVPAQHGRLLVIKHGALGDLVHTMGAFKALRAAYPTARIDVLTTQPYAAWLAACPYIDRVLVDTRPRFYDARGWLALRQLFKAGGYHAVCDLQNSNRTSLYWRLFFKHTAWCGYTAGASHCPPDTLAARRTMHVFAALQAQLAFIGITDITPDDLNWMQADLSPFALPMRYALLIPGSSPTRKIKRWPAERFAGVANALVACGVTPVLIGTASERDVCTHIIAACSQAIDLSGRTSLFDLAALARSATWAIGNDTGPLHVVAASGCHTLGLFPAFSNPARHGPLGAHVHTITGATMADISTESVLQNMASLLPHAA